jgi:hypothetical protein
MTVAAAIPEVTANSSVRETLDKVRAEGRDALTAPEGTRICDSCPRIHALILGYRHTIVSRPMVLAELTSQVVVEHRAKGVRKPVVASLAEDTEVEKACEYLFDHRAVAYPYTTERPIAVPGAKYRWVRATGLTGG